MDGRNVVDSVKLPRLAFFRQGQATTLPPARIPFQSGVPLTNGSTITEHLDARTLVGNLGNMIHRMAMIQMVKCDRARSSQLNIFKMISTLKSVEKVADIINTHFDGMMMTMSNILRPDAQEPDIAALVRALKVPVYCLGIGLQGDLPKGNANVLTPDVRDLVFALEESAALFGVRGEQTSDWLRSIGIKNAKALGCPSMFAYPRNILSIESPEKYDRIITAGHLKLTSDQKSRGHRLMHGFTNTSPSYVFQGEIAQFKDLLDIPGIYDEATQTLDASSVNNVINQKCRVQTPFGKYYSFGESSAWRQACTKYDVYVGDRIHGGVAAMQVGVPALVLHADTRVQELTSYHGIPSCSLEEFARVGVRRAIEGYLNGDAISSFKERYRSVLHNFESECASAGLNLSNRLPEKHPTIA